MSEPKLLLAPLKSATIPPRIWSAGHFIEDTWRRVGDEEPLPIEGRAIVSLKRWRSEQRQLVEHGIETGILVEPADVLDAGTDNLARLQLVALSFPKFTDGRAYSTARRLREQWNYRGELRAVGDVLIDQIPLMLRTGFDSFEITNAPTAAALERGEVPAVLNVYQRGTPIRGGWQSRRSA